MPRPKRQAISRRLDTPIKIYSPPDYADANSLGDYGEVSRDAADRTLIARVWAEIVGTNGSEVEVDGRLQAIQEYRLTMRRIAGLSTGYEIDVGGTGLYSGATLSIVAFERDDGARGETTTVICRRAR